MTHESHKLATRAMGSKPYLSNACDVTRVGTAMKPFPQSPQFLCTLIRIFCRL